MHSTLSRCTFLTDRGNASPGPGICSYILTLDSASDLEEFHTFLRLLAAGDVFSKGDSFDAKEITPYGLVHGQKVANWFTAVCSGGGVTNSSKAPPNRLHILSLDGVHQMLDVIYQSSRQLLAGLDIKMTSRLSTDSGSPAF